MKISYRNIFTTILLTIGFTTLTFAQTVDEAGAELNKAIKLQKNKNYLEAAKTFEKAFKMAEKVGPDADAIKKTAKEQIPNSYYKDAVESYKSKNYLEAIEKFNTVNTVAKKYGDEKLADKSKNIVPQLYNALGNSMRKSEKFEESLQYYDKAIELKPNYAKAYLGKMLVYKEMDKTEDLMTAFEKIKEIKKDKKSLESANQVLKNYALIKAKEAFDAKDHGKALEFTNQFADMGNLDAQESYLAAVIYNANKKFKEAVDILSNTEQTADKDLKSNMYFELGTAYVGMNNTQKACESFKKAVNGPNGKAAQYQMKEVLKCN